MNEAQVLSSAKTWQLENLPYEIMWLNEEGEVVYINKLLRKRLGYRENEIESLTILDINPRTSMEYWRQHWQEVSEIGSEEVV